MKYFDDYKKHYLKTMGWKIYYARRAKGLTQTRLAEMAGLNRETVGKIENTLVPAPNIETMLKLAYVLGMTPEELFSGKEKE